MPYRDYEPWLEEAQALHQALPVFVGYYNFTESQFQPSGARQRDIEKMDAAHVRALVASIGYGCYFQIGPNEYQLAGSDEWLYRSMLKRVDWVAETIRRCPRTRLITRAAELTFKPGDDAIGVIIHMTGNNQILSLEAVDAFFAHGVRATHPAMGYHNRWCSGTEGKPSDPVLTEFGREVIARYNELGVVLDTAHATDASAQAMIRASTKPVIDGHTTSRNLVPQSRGLSDDTLKMIADTGGVVGIHFADHLLTSEVWRQKYARSESDGVARRRSRPRLWEYNKYVLALTQDPEERVRLRKNREAQESFFRERNLSPDPSESTPPVRVATLKHMGDAIDYLVNLLGIEHVAVGGDVDGIDDHSWPDGMDHVGELAHLTAELMRRGYKEEALRKFLAENWLRVYRQCLPP